MPDTRETQQILVAIEGVKSEMGQVKAGLGHVRDQTKAVCDRVGDLRERMTGVETQINAMGEQVREKLADGRAKFQAVDDRLRQVEQCTTVASDRWKIIAWVVGGLVGSGGLGAVVTALLSG